MDHTDEINHSGRDLFDRKPVRVGLFVVIPGIIFVLVCIGIRVSQLGIDHTIVVIGQDEIVAGSPAAVRITLIADGSGFFMPDSVDAHLVRGQQRHLLFSGSVNEEGYALGRNFTVPDIDPGPAVMELDIRFDERRRIVRCDVDVVKAPPEFTVIRPEDATPGEVPLLMDGDGNLIQALTEDRGAPTGLTSVLFVRSQDRNGEPATISMKVGLPGKTGSADPIVEKLETDRLGLAALAIKPADLDFPLRVYGASRHAARDPDGGIVDGGPEDEEPAYLFPRVIYSGIAPSVHNPIATHGEPFRVTVRQISMGGPMYVDLFKDGRWIDATSSWVTGDGKAELKIHPPTTGLMRMQITNSALGAGRTIAVRHVYALADGQDVSDGIRDILGRLRGRVDGRWADAVRARRLEGGAGFDRRLLSAFVLSRLYSGHQEVQRLVSSRREDDAELGDYKSTVQRGVMLVIILLGFAVAFLIGTVAAGAHRRRSRMEALIMNEADLDPSQDCDADTGAGVSRRRMILQGAILFVIIVGAFTAIALLVDTMTWGG